MQRTTMDLWVGVFVLAGIGALLLLAFKVGNLGTYSSADSYTLTGSFENIGGLKVKAPVKGAGVVVGRVTNIQFNTTTYDAVVTLSIDNRYEGSFRGAVYRYGGGRRRDNAEEWR